MMSLSKISSSQLIMRQYQLKLKSHIGFLSSLVTLQLVAILFSLGGIGQGGRGGLDISMTMHYYTPDYVVIFTIMWAFITAYQLVKKESWEQDYIFVTNRFTSHMANMLFLLTTSVISSVLASLAVFPLQIIGHFVLDFEYILGTGLSPSVLEFIVGLSAMILFIFLMSIIGYLVGILVQGNKVFSVLLPAFVIGFLFLTFRMEQAGKFNPLLAMYDFYLQENSFLLYGIKVILTAGLVFAVSMQLSRKLEVR